MRRIMKTGLLLSAALIAFHPNASGLSGPESLTAAAAENFEIVSPDGRQSVNVEIAAGQAGTEVFYSVSFEGKQVILPSRMELVLDNHVWERAMGKSFRQDAAWPDGMELTDTTVISRDTVWHNAYGERSSVRDAWRGIVFHFARNDGSQYRLDIEVRAYDEGIAFRYCFPMHPASIFHRIKADNTEFAFPEGSLAWYTSWAQGKYELRPFEAWESDCERPLTVKISDSLYAAVGEAGVSDFPRMKLKLGSDRTDTVTASLNDDGTDIYTPYNMPWRVVMAATRPGDLIENNDIFLNLNDASAISDESWIKPGKIMRETRLSTENAFAVVDFCSKHDMQYILFDTKWYGPEFDPRSDATKVREGLDLQEVIAYARQKGIGVWLYVNNIALTQQAEELFPLFEEWGVAGVKFGFVHFCNQYWSQRLHYLVRLAAEHHLMVNIHDEYRPTGYSRTYPNLLTQEGIRGNEEFPSAGHDTVLPFTRMLCGAGDYTVCYFDPRLENTHAHQLALPVVIFSPLQTLYWYDTPARIKDVPELEFFDEVPVVWDDTEVLDDSIGEHVVIARRSGDEWFAGAIAGDLASRIEIRTGEFLDRGRKYLMKVYTDDDTAGTPTGVRAASYLIEGGRTLEFRLKARGGAAMQFIPADGAVYGSVKKLPKNAVL